MKEIAKRLLEEIDERELKLVIAFIRGLLHKRK